MVMSVILVLALTLATQGTFQLRLATNQGNTGQARNLAESAIALAVDVLSDDQDFGVGTPTASDTIRAQFVSGGPESVVTFDPRLAASLEQPVSVNNLENDASVTLESGRAIPPFSAYLATRASHNGVSVTLEAVLHVPVYPYAIATSGNLSSTGGLFVAAVDELADLNNGLATLPPEEVLPGHIAANGTQNMVLDSSSQANQTIVTGDAQAGGSVTLGQFTTIQGSIRQNASPEALPDLQLANYDNADFAGLVTIGASQLRNTINPLNPVSMEGPYRKQGDLTIQNGLELNGGYLYVDGDLHIQGELSGKGAVFVDGEMKVDRAGAFSTDNVQAILAQGDIDIQGGSNAAASDSAFLTGVLYNKGDVRLSNVSILGSLVNNSQVETSLELSQANLIHVPEVIEFEWDFGGADLSGLHRAGGMNAPFELGLPGQTFMDKDNIDDYFDSSADSFRVPTSAEETAVALYAPQRYVQNSAAITPELYRNAGSFTSVEELADFFLSFRTVGSPSPLRHLTIKAGLGVGELPVLNPTRDDWITYLTPIFEQYQVRTYNRIYNSDILYRKARQESLRSGKLKLDPSQFLQFEDAVRVIWMDERP